MNYLAIIAIDLLFIGILTFAIYFPRHRRRDLVVAFLGVNVGVLAVSLVLGSSTIGAGLGLGLFGVLSIIRLRSDEIEQHEVAYYFSALALGLLSGLSGGAQPLTIGLMVLLVAVMFVGDHPRLFARSRQQTIVIDTAFTDEVALTAHLERVLGGRVRQVQVKSLDLVNDTTTVDVRFDAPEGAGRGRGGAGAAACAAGVAGGTAGAAAGGGERMRGVGVPTTALPVTGGTTAVADAGGSSELRPPRASHSAGVSR